MGWMSTSLRNHSSGNRECRCGGLSGSDENPREGVRCSGCRDCCGNDSRGGIEHCCRSFHGVGTPIFRRSIDNPRHLNSPVMSLRGSQSRVTELKNQNSSGIWLFHWQFAS
jgi:hypothetical protein